LEFTEMRLHSDVGALPLWLAVFSTFFVRRVIGQRFAEALSRQGTSIIHESLNGATIRQCSCDEQKICLTELREQTYACFDKCWIIVKPLTNHPDQLKACFSSKEHVLEGFFSCLESNIKSCVLSENGPQIPHADIRRLIANTEKRVVAKSRDILRTLEIHGKALLEKALEVAGCIKECVIDENTPRGFCFERKGCLPKVDSYDTEFTLKRCMRSTKWKKEAGELCTCSVRAGVSGAQEYCSMLSPFVPVMAPAAAVGQSMSSSKSRRS